MYSPEYFFMKMEKAKYF